MDWLPFLEWLAQVEVMLLVWGLTLIFLVNVLRNKHNGGG